MCLLRCASRFPRNPIYKTHRARCGHPRPWDHRLVHQTRGPAYILLCPIPWLFNHDDASDEIRSARPTPLAAVNLTRGTIVWSIKLAARHISLCPIPWISNRARLHGVRCLTQCLAPSLNFRRKAKCIFQLLIPFEEVVCVLAGDRLLSDATSSHSRLGLSATAYCRSPRPVLCR